MISYEQAHQKALDRVAQIATQSTFEIVILESHIRETDAAWYFPYDGRDYVENGNFLAALAGNHPVRVAKTDGAVTLESPPDHDAPHRSRPRTVG